MSATKAEEVEVQDGFHEFLRNYYHDEVAQLAQDFPEERKSLVINWNDIFRYDPGLLDDFRQRPGKFRRLFETALQKFDLPIDISLDGVNVRVENIPSQHVYTVGSYRSDQLGMFLGVRGQVQKRTEVKPRPEVAAFECQRCGSIMTIPQVRGEHQEPHECSGCERQGPFRLNESRTEWVDHQLIRLQRPPELTKGGTSPTLDVYLEDDLVNEVEGGDRVVVGGSLEIADNDDDGAYEMRIRAHSLAVEETDYEELDLDEHRERVEELAAGEEGDPYGLLIDSIGTTVHGYDTIKEALALQLFGGVRREKPDGETERGDPHVLLLGDPGTAKSTLLEDITKLAPRSTFASGKGASAAGLTAAAVRDDFGGEEWSLEAGALVEADKGIAAIDEFDKVNEDALSSLHGALSRQKVNVNKAGMNATMPTRTTVLAAGNPEFGRFRSDRRVHEQIDIEPALFSRFDVAYMLTDRPDAETDAEIIDGKLDTYHETTQVTEMGDRADAESTRRAVDREVIRAWIAIAKQEVFPTIEDESVEQDLKESFHTLRQSNGEGEDVPVPVNWRDLDAHYRLMQASARVRLSDTIEQQDLERARRLYGRFLQDIGMDEETGSFDVDIVETGSSAAQKDKIAAVLEYLSEHEGAEPVGHEQIVEVGANDELERGEVEYALKKLKKQGEIYEPNQDQYRVVE